MKRKLLIPLLFFVTCSSLVGCSKSLQPISYGTYITQTTDSLMEISNLDLYNKTQFEGETFILATYQSEYSYDCECWKTYENVIVNYINKYHEKVYIFDAQNQSEMISYLQIDKYNDSTPSLYIFNGANQLAKFTYKNNQDKAIFSDITGEAMHTRIHEYVRRPVLFEVNDQILTTNLKQKDEAVVMFVRSSCSDCSYVLPNILIPYIEKTQFNKEIWYCDLDVYYKLSKAENASERDKEQYQNIKDRYNLSTKNNQTYGYGQGVVPTIQYYKNGVLTDASVYANDTVMQKDDGSFYIKESYYSNERLTSLSYCKNVTNNVLQGMTINKDDVAVSANGYVYWPIEKAAFYHTPLFEAFLDFYCK